MAEGAARWAVFGAALSLLALITAGDALSPSRRTVGVLSVIPVFAAAWLLGPRLSILITALAALGRILAVGFGDADPVTAAAQAAVLPFIAIVTRVGGLALQETRARAADDALIARIAGFATSSQDLDEILRAIIRELAGSRLRGGSISLINERQELYIAAAAGELAPEVRAARLPLGTGIMGRVAAEGTSILVRDLDAPDAPTSPTRGLGSNAAMRSIACAPLRAAGTVIGVIEIDSTDADAFTEADLRLLEQSALAASGAVQRAGALQLADRRLQERIRELAILLEAARGLVRATEVQDLLRQIVRSCAQVGHREIHGPPTAALWRLRGEGAELELVQQFDELGHAAEGRSYRLADLPAAQTALEAGRAVAAPSPSGPEAGGFQVYAPILISSRPYAMVAVGSREPAPFSEEELRLLDGMADLAGLALASVQKLELERARAVELQEHADRMAALDKIKSEFLRLASHELRGPLAVLRGYTSMLDDGSLGQLPPLASGVLPVLTAKVSEMGRLIDQMLETARMEDASVTLNLETADLRRLVREAVEDARWLATPAHRLILELPAEPVTASVDAARVINIVGNLVDNAVKYSPDGGEIRIRLRALESRAQVEVADEGLGIDADGLAVLFTRFGRVVTKENSHINGTGLGLYLCRELARMHGGEITASSQIGRGSVFVLELPLAQPGAEA